MTDFDVESFERLIFGDSFDETVQSILCDAARANTEQGWRDASQQILGLQRLVVYLDGANPQLRHLTMKLIAYQTLIGPMTYDEHRRAGWGKILAGYQEALHDHQH